jgi:uncharacterized membrane protein YuzA (DUF378 family)
MSQIIPGSIVFLAGVVTILGALFNWGIVMSPVKLIPRLLGPTISRIVFVVLGIALIGLGLGLTLGWM